MSKPAGLPPPPAPNVVGHLERRDDRVTMQLMRPLGRPPYLVITRERRGRSGEFEVSDTFKIWNRELPDFAAGVAAALEQSIAFAREQADLETQHLTPLDATVARRTPAEVCRELRVLRRADRRPDFFERLYRLKCELYMAVHGWQAPFPTFVTSRNGLTMTRVRLARKNKATSNWDFSVHFSWAVFPEGEERPRNTNPRSKPPRQGLRLLASEMKPALLVWDVVDGATRLVCVPDETPRGAICWHCHAEFPSSADANIAFRFKGPGGEGERLATCCRRCMARSAGVERMILRRLRAEGWPLAAHVGGLSFTAGEL